MITLRKFLSDFNLWGFIKSIESFDFIDDDGSFLNNLQKIEYGQRILFNQFENLEFNEVAKIIVKLYSNKWNSLILTEFNKLNILSDSVKLTNYEGSVNSSDDDTSKTISQVSAYNDVELIDDSGTSTDSIKTSSSNKDGVESVLNLSYKNLFDNLNNVQKSNIINIVLLDVTKYLTLDIY